MMGTSGFTALVRKEATEIVRTWRLWVLPGMLVFFALTGPPLAKYTPQLLQALAGADAAAIVKLMGTPTFYDSYASWIKNLSQIIFFAIVIIYAGLVSSETKSGTAILVLTKPVSRPAFVLAKLFVHEVFITLGVVLGTAVTWGMTLAVFGEAPGAALWQASLSWLVLAWFFVALMALLSVLMPSQAGAAGVGIGLWALLALTAMIPAAVLLSPAGLIVTPSAVAMGKAFPSVWPVVTSIIATVVVAAGAAAAFGRREI